MQCYWYGHAWTTLAANTVRCERCGKVQAWI
jgi:hypothetical protein